jgi:hypothetical protein
MNVFISYRRSDTQDFVGRIADRLRRTHGISDVFLDVEEIAAGEDFEERIKTALLESKVSLIVIGRDWRGAVSEGTSRIFRREDPVRMEVRAALTSETTILPVLANEASMPRPEELPDDIRAIATLNAFSVRHGDFERDCEHLLNAIFARKKPGRLAAFLRRNPTLSRFLQSLGGAAAACALLFAALVILHSETGLALSNVTGGRGPATLAGLVIVLLGAAMPFLLRRRGSLRR